MPFGVLDAPGFYVGVRSLGVECLFIDILLQKLVLIDQHLQIATLSSKR